MKGHALITGASSSIARALAELLAQDGHHLILAGRDIEDLEHTAADLRTRFGISVDALAFDATAFAEHDAFFTSALDRSQNQLDRIVICHGLLLDREGSEDGADLAKRMIDVNYTSVATLLERAASHFEQQKRGAIAVVSSVAGDRGRQSNYLYGAPKAGLNTYLAGLRHRLAPLRIPVLIIKPGFVDTRMTWGRPGLFLVASPQRVARDIYKAMGRRRHVLYTPWFWRWIMLIIRSVPTFLFHRTKL